MKPSYVSDRLQRLGQRVVGIGWIAAVGWGLLAALGFVLAAAWVDLVWELPSAARAWAWWVGVIVGLGVAIWFVRQAYARRDPHFLAERIDALAETGGQIRTAVDLLEERERQTQLTAGLARLAIARSGALIDKVASEQVAPSRPVGVSYGGLTLLAALVIVCFFVAPRLAWTQWRRFTRPYDDHAPYSRVWFEVEPGNVQLYFGTGLEIRARIHGGAADRLELLLAAEGSPGEEVLPMFPEGEGNWRALVSSVTASGHYLVRARGARSERFRIDVLTVPKIEAVRFRIVSPAYANLPAYEGPAPQAGIAGLAGTKVEVWARSNRPLSGGALDVETRRDVAQMTMQPTAAGGQEVHGTFEIDDSGKLSLRVIDVDKQTSTDEFTATVTLLPDERPFIRLLEPPERSFATPNVVLPVVLAAEDDYGIARVQLYQSVKDSPLPPMELAIPRPAPTRWQEVVQLPLSTYGLSPGDEIKLFARVEDNDPAGPKGSESNVVVVRIIAQEDFDRLLRRQQGMEVLQSKYQQAERRLESILEDMEKLQKELEALPPDDEVARRERERLNELAKEMEKGAAAMREAAKHDLPYDIDKALKQRLEDLAKDVEAAAKEARASGEAQPGMPRPTNTSAAKRLGEARARLQDERKEYQEQALQPLEDFAKIYPLYEDMARFVDLYQRQRSLADRMQSLDGQDQKDDPQAKARMRDLETEQRTLRESLERLLEDVDAHADQLPADPELNQLRDTARQFVKDVAASGAEEAMQECEGHLGDFSGAKSRQAARKAEQELEKFVSRCQGGNGMAGQCKSCMKFNPNLNSCVGDSLEQMLGDSGLATGDGMGVGQGAGRDGYAMRRGAMDNVGLYGHSPFMRSSSQRGGGMGRQGDMPGGRQGTRDERPNPRDTSAGPLGRVGGASEAAVPPSYRRKVADYFQRIAEETGK